MPTTLPLPPPAALTTPLRDGSFVLVEYHAKPGELFEKLILAWVAGSRYAVVDASGDLGLSDLSTPPLKRIIRGGYDRQYSSVSQADWDAASTFEDGLLGEVSLADFCGYRDQIFDEVEEVSEPLENKVGEEGEIGRGEGIEAGSAVASVAAGMFELVAGQGFNDELRRGENVPAVFSC